MKIVVFSDSHGEIEPMFSAVTDESPDIIIHLGDNVSDAEELHRMYPGPALLVVAGNCDLASIESRITELEISGRRLILTHGHTFAVKTPEGRLRLLEYAKRAGADVTLFGHTHTPCHRFEDGILLANPGHIGQNTGGGRASYGVLNFYDDSGMDWKTILL